MTDAEAFSWISEEHERQLEDSSTSAWEGQWPEYLGKYLDQTWSSWQNESDETRTDWLQDRIQSIALGWVSTEQQTQLDSLASTNGDWREWLSLQLDEWWPDWSKASPTELTTWFDGALPALLPEQPAAATTPAEDPRDLSWLTPDQQAQLDTLTATRGDWHTWLPTQMDTWWPDWTSAAPDQLAAWFDGALPSLADGADAAPADPDGAGQPEFTDTARTDLWERIPALAVETGLSEDDLRAEFSKLTLEEIEAALNGDLSAVD